jgi:tetratricopeptide (TPR) repeat protein
MSELDRLARAGIAAINERCYDEAITSFQAALALDPDRPDLNNALGMAFLHRGEVGGALPYLRRAVAAAGAFDPVEHREMRVHFVLGLVSALQQADLVGEARAALRDALTVWPDEPELRFAQGQVAFSCGLLEEGRAAWRGVQSALGADQRAAVEATLGSLDALLDSEHGGEIFLQAHQAEYVAWFDEVAGQQEAAGWYAEAARMARRNGEVVPILAEGARPWALSRVDLVNPATGEVASVYSEAEPMIAAVEGLEVLAQVPLVVPWRGWPFAVGVGTQCPWHQLSVIIDLQDPLSEEERAQLADDLIGPWYLDGYNGAFGTATGGRFHFVSDPEPLGPSGFSFQVDLGRARFEAIEALLRRLVVQHDRRPVRQVLLGRGRLPGGVGSGEGPE